MQINEIREYWLLLNSRHGSAGPLATDTVNRILAQYGAEDRYYHNTRHLTDLICLQQQYAPFIVDNDSLLFAIYFHDLVCKASQHDNEEKSAQEALRFLKKIGYPEEKQQKVYAFIMATKGHQNPLADPDLDYFLDFDLHILGASPSLYDAYTKQVRKEYSRYPSFFYKKGRKRVLQHFLGQTCIYHTAAFREKYEKRARENMERELEGL
ncbi:HD domain-containing protein [Chitinophaga cymbidii]|uniref:Metal-dependent HD superfamily phosphohydrolase n=1 Tax=Chitinophaga cymbidii TaxID=1096750 RepID=A0A512RDK0_9BACT|nr:hypothetical protein [Chitinophaga cymbidii]GEP93767.1 hypothetical protein CCY01nite_00270 [Chitinophaga cymbidii]